MAFKLFKSKSVNTVAFFNIIGPIILNGINFFTLPIFTRLLGAENFGQVSLYITWVQVISILVGLETSGTISTAKVYIKEKNMDNYCSSVLILSFASFLIISSIIIIFNHFISSFTKMNFVLILIALLNGFGKFIISFETLKFCILKESYKTFFISMLVGISEVVLSIIFIINIQQFELKSNGRIYGIAITNIIIGTTLFFKIMFRSKFNVSKEHMKFCLPVCLPLMFHSMSHLILAQSDRIMLQHFSTESIVGIYSFIFTVTQIINVIGTALNYTWTAFYIDDLKEKKYEMIRKRTTNYIYLFTALTICLMFIFPEIIKYFSPIEFWSGIELVPIMALSSFFIFLYTLPSNFECFYKKTIYIAIGTTCAAVLNIILNFVLIPNRGILGASVATAISYLLLFVFHEFIARYVIKHEYPRDISNCIKSIIVVCMLSLLFYFIKDLVLLRFFIALVTLFLLIKRVIKNGVIF